MLPLSANKSNQGFTLLETATIVAIVGILAAISAPSLLGWYNRTKVDSALNEVRGALQQAQREAMRKSKSCTVTFDTTDNEITGSDGCLVTGDRDLDEMVRDLDGVKMAANLGNISFSYKGNTTNAGTIVLYSNNTDHKRCIAISNGLGIMRTGIYSGSTSSVSAESCDTSP